MASVTAEVMLNFGVSLSDHGGKEFSQAVDSIRFGMGDGVTSREIIDILRPIWRTAHDDGYSDGYDNGVADSYDQRNDGG